MSSILSLRVKDMVSGESRETGVHERHSDTSLTDAICRGASFCSQAANIITALKEEEKWYLTKLGLDRSS